MRRSGLASLLLILLVLGACRTVRYGFAGGGLPAHVRTVAVLPFENRTALPDLTGEIHQLLGAELERRLGLRNAPEQRADALVSGVILRYDADVPIGFSADPRQANTARRKLQIAVDISIVDQTTGRTLWERRNLVVDGEYAERADVEGRQRALEQLVNQIIEGAQSQW